jgi:hypothetical protein
MDILFQNNKMFLNKKPLKIEIPEIKYKHQIYDHDQVIKIDGSCIIYYCGYSGEIQKKIGAPKGKSPSISYDTTQ